MACALNSALCRGLGKAVIVGTDCAALRAADLHLAFAALERHDCVIKPADDGGFVLIGTRKPIHAALRGIAWSSGQELRQTCQRLRLRGISLHLLPPTWDVDRPQDFRRAKREGYLL